MQKILSLITLAGVMLFTIAFADHRGSTDFYIHLRPAPTIAHKGYWISFTCGDMIHRVGTGNGGYMNIDNYDDEWHYQARVGSLYLNSIEWCAGTLWNHDMQVVQRFISNRLPIALREVFPDNVIHYTLTVSRSKAQLEEKIPS